MRYKLTLEYDGTNLIGWQENATGLSVQSLLQEAIFKFCGEHVNVVAAGRTDAGVHATGMVAHFDFHPRPCGGGRRGAVSRTPGGGLDEENLLNPSPASLCSATPAAGAGVEPDVIMRAINFYLTQMKAPVCVLSCESVSDDFHARFSCTKRHYKYMILNRPAPAILEKNRVWHIPRPLDIDAMKSAAKKLIGNHDFTSFRASECQSKSPIKTIDEIGISSEESGISITVSAKSFLHHQVRNIVGTLVEIGRGKTLDIEEILAAKNRSAAGPTAPASGLYFVSAEYI